MSRKDRIQRKLTKLSMELIEPGEDFKIKQVLDQLIAGNKLTVLTAWRICGTSELRSIVCRLRKRGHDIKSKRVPGQNYNMYYID